MKITKNVGKTDQIIRIIAGAILLLVGFFVDMSTALGIILMIFGAILLVTGIIRFCPLYTLFKFSTNK